ncbi:uncharacterized protein LOC114362485 [Ostrinia furnacalis]|uniref:uncharacterized protein LOC114362485 n=1 Tax=Ostrinia furnacalis TaxID=93504 RepID=UPI00103EF582|nr:uncharacterized protein LOC114362485 [Ostrinia furnacalis]
MTATATRTSQAVTEWTKVFPKQVTENYTSSVTFMKQLTVIAVSTITYLKNAFPEDSYSMENFGGLKLRILKKKCKDDLAHFLSTALTQAFEAFDKKYLHQLALCFYEDECKMENLIEYHVFEYTYNDDGVTMSVSSKTRDSGKTHARYTFDGVRERTVHLIRACVVIMQTCQQHLPETYDVSLRLYYNEDAPEGYQAPGFNAAAEADDHLEPTLRDTIKLGWVETPYHRVVARSYMKDSMGASHEAIDVIGKEHLEPTLRDTIKLGWVETPYHRVVARSYMKDSMGASHEAIPSQNPPVMSQMEQEEFTSSLARSASGSSERLLQCPCNKYGGETQNMLLLTCQYCNTQQHAACFGLMSEDFPRAATHCCTACSDEDPTRIPTDPRLVALSAKKRECLCIFRRTLALCRGWGTASARRLETALGVSAANAAKLARLLRSHAVTAPMPDLNTPSEIDPDQLKSVMNKFFQVAEEESIVDRLLAETFASQESQPDPVGDVLGPMEKVSLQNASNLGRVIETPVDLNKTTEIEDLTLKQYKEALLSNYQMDEDLPLSGSNNPLKEIENLGKRRITKRKINDENDENKPKLRTGVRTKRAKAKA